MEVRQVSIEEFISIGNRIHKRIQPNTDSSHEKHTLGIGETVCLATSDDNSRIALLPANDSNESYFMMYGRSDTLNNASAIHNANQLVKQLSELVGNRIIGPIEHTTWHRYRMVENAGAQPAFPGEYFTPAEWCQDLLQAGFSIRERYESLMVPRIGFLRLPAFLNGIWRAKGKANFRRYRGEDAISRLGELYKLAISAFSANPLYKPIDEQTFRQLYTLPAHLLPSIMLSTAEQDGKIMAFAFSYSIGKWGVRQRPTAVLKSIASSPEARGQGLGYWVSYDAHRGWYDEKHIQMIYAYLHTQNLSRKMAVPFAKPFRSYVLLELNGTKTTPG